MLVNEIKIKASFFSPSFDNFVIISQDLLGRRGEEKSGITGQDLYICEFFFQCFIYASEELRLLAAYIIRG